MQNTLLVSPVLAMVGLTFVVWAYMYVLRLGYIVKHKMDMDPFKSPAGADEALPRAINYPSYNLKNLFEMPVLFYALCIVAMVLGMNDVHLLYAAWWFVGLRVLHSVIQCTFNNVSLRFSVYMLSSIALMYLFYVMVRLHIG